MNNYIGLVLCIFITIVCLGKLGADGYHKTILVAELQAEIIALNTVLDLRAAAIKECTVKIDRYEYIIGDMMQGQWEPGMGLRKDFVEEWYGTAIWSFKAIRRPPGSPAIDIGEVLDRKLGGE